MKRITPVLCIALGMTLGLQLLRVFIPTVAWYLRDTKSVPTLQLIPWAVAPFLLAFAAPLARRVLRERALLGVGLMLAVVRVAEQIATSPTIDLGLSILGVTLWLWFVGLALGALRASFAEGMLLGFAIDTGIRALGATLDLSWIERPWTLPVVLALCIAAVALVATTETEKRRPVGLVALSLAPLLFVQMVLMQVPGGEATSLGRNLLWVATGNVIGVAAARRGAASLGFMSAMAAAGLPFLAGAAVAGGMRLLVGAVMGAWAGWIFAERRNDRRDPGVLVASSGMLFVALALGYYMSLDVSLGVDQQIVAWGIVPGVILLLGLFGLPSVVEAESESAEEPWRAPAVAAAIAGALVLTLVFNRGPEPAEGTGGGLKVMTYNVHSGFNTAGRQDPEEIARVIESSGADVVALQEVSRGWLLDGSTDLLAWLARRLRMNFAAFHATADDQWGNAILSRYEIDVRRTGFLPLEGTLLRRGVMVAEIEGSPVEDLTLMVTHLHHQADDLAAVHKAQLTEVLKSWPDRERVMMLGDFNATPDSGAVTQILHDGFLDSWVGPGPGLTSYAANPTQRIDYIFHTPDLVASDTRVIESQASDHFALVTTIDDPSPSP